MSESERYEQIVESSEEDDCFVGTCRDLFYGGCPGDDAPRAYLDLCEIVNEWAEILGYDRKAMPSSGGR